ncbi:MAG: diguanylate cyclase [Methylophaga sp.]|nr:MAG: diguanylate cyclase [Methylophaga sp.]
MSLLNIPLKYRIFIAVAIYILWVFTFAYYSFSQEKSALYVALDQKLEMAALTASLLLPDKLHHQNMADGQLSDQEDTQNRLTLSNYTDSTDIVYLYSLILRDNKILFTSSSATPQERQSSEELSDYFDHYDDADPRIFEIFDTKKKAFLEYTDQWGSFRSSFIPRYSADGTFYLAAADLSTTHIQTLLNQHLYKIIAFALLFLLFAYPIYLVSKQYISRKVSELELQLQQKSITLTKNQQRLERALQSAKQAWFEINVQTGVIKASEEYSALLGIHKDQVSTIDNWKNSIHPDDRDATMEKFFQNSQSDETVELEFRRKTISGNWAWIHSSGQVIERDSDGNPLTVVGINRDITNQKRSELVLQVLAESAGSSSEDIFKTIVRQLALSYDMRYALIATVNTDLTQAITLALWAKDQFIENISYDLAGTPCETIITDMGGELYADNIQQLFPDDQMLVQMQARSYLGVPLRNKNNEVLGLISIINDQAMAENPHTTALLKSLAVRASIELERQSNEERLVLFAHMFRDSHEGILLVDKNDIIIDANPIICTNTGYLKTELVGKPAQIFRSEAHQYPFSFYENIRQSIVHNSSWQGEVWNRMKSGEEKLASVTITQIVNNLGQTTHRFILVNDITEQKQQQDALKFMAHYDALTKLPNRTLFVDRFNQAVAHSKRSETLLAICFLDLDNFKPINDNYGHEVGDKILIEVARRISSNLREEDTVSRQGGDEFTLLIGNIDSFGQCEQTLTRILHSVAKPYSINGYTHTISVSIGVTLYPLDDSDIDTLTRHADHAMYQAKQAGKNQYRLFDRLDDMQKNQQQQQQQQLQHALQHDQFCLHYQPKINMKTGKVFGMEALIRWQHPEKGMLFPLDFLPAAENTNLENKIGVWVIEEALSQMNIWHQQGIELEVSVNISPNHLQSASFISHLEKALADHPEINPQLLQLEILESSALGDINTISNIIKICHDSLGVSLALDDFGTGYSSLTHLRNLSVQTIKIDRSFVRDLLDIPNDFVIIDGIISLADSFNREIIAEGVETINQGLMLLAMGCDQAQGYGISKAMPAQDIPLWLKNYKPHYQWIEFGNKQQSLLDKKVKILEFTTGKWFDNIKATIASSGKIKPQSPLALCHLGAWISQLRKGQLFEESWLNKIQQSHDELFALAEKTMGSYLTGHYPIALDQLKQLQIIFDDLIAILNKEKLL